MKIYRNALNKPQSTLFVVVINVVPELPAATHQRFRFWSRERYNVGRWGSTCYGAERAMCRPQIPDPVNTGGGKR